MQRGIHTSQILPAHQLLVEYVEEFELLYYQHRVDRLHFVRPCIHLLIHLMPDVFCTGPGACHSQWTTENYIGNITREIKQHSTPYANVAERALRRCQVNALKAMYPELVKESTTAAGLSIEVGNHYTLLHPRDSPETWAVRLDSEKEAIRTWLRSVNMEMPHTWKPHFHRWGRLRLPNGQIARSAWKENRMEENGQTPRRARMVKVCHSCKVSFDCH